MIIPSIRWQIFCILILRTSKDLEKIRLNNFSSRNRMWFLHLFRYSWRQWNHERQMRSLKCRTMGCMSDSLCWLILHAEHAAKQRLEKRGSDLLLIPFQWLQPSRFRQSKMIWLRTHLLHALEWLSIRIQLPKDNPLRGKPHRFTFFSQWVFSPYLVIQFFKH